MLRKTTRFTIGVALAALVAISATPLLAAEEIVDVQNHGEALVFVPTISAADFILTVTGPCNYLLTRSLKEHGELVFETNQTTIDGRYRFEVTAVPEIDSSIIKVLNAARAAGDNSEVEQLCRDGKLPGDPQVLTAGFGIFRGQIIYDPSSIEKAGGAAEKPGSLDKLAFAGAPGLDSARSDVVEKQVISGDLTVYNSVCIGFDCLANESYSFDTLRLKENNLRIHFDDTSTAGSYPRTDWRIEANSSVNGGGSYLRFVDASANRSPFTVEANASSNALYVDDGGRIGNGTATPSVEVHVVDGDTPTLRLAQDGSSGFQPQNWDVAGNETSFFIRDATNGSTLPFRIRPGSPSNALVIDTDGDVGIGTLTSDEALHIAASDANATKVLIKNTNASAQVVGFDLSNTSQEWSVRSGTNGHFVVREVGGDVVLDIDPSNNQVTVAGNLVTGGGGTCDPGPCDGTFTDYDLESIEDHAAYMWENQHLWGVGPTPDGQPINLSKKTTGILHELEKAHIYIEQLNTTIKQLSSRLEVLEGAPEATE